MAWGKKSNKKKYLPMSGFWSSKNIRNLRTGSMDKKRLKPIIELFQKAVKKGKNIQLSLWYNPRTRGNQPKFNLQASISEPYKKYKAIRDEERRREERRDERRDEREEERREDRDRMERGRRDDQQRSDARRAPRRAASSIDPESRRSDDRRADRRDPRRGDRKDVGGSDTTEKRNPYEDKL